MRKNCNQAKRAAVGIFFLKNERGSATTEVAGKMFFDTELQAM